MQTRPRVDTKSRCCMFDKNEFKRQVKLWIRENPAGSETDLIDFCDDLIPPAQFSANQWLVDQTVSWYRHIQEHRNKALESFDDEEHSTF